MRGIEDVWFEIGAATLLQTHNVIYGEDKKRGVEQGDLPKIYVRGKQAALQGQ